MGLCQSGNNDSQYKDKKSKRGGSLPALSKLQRYNTLGLAGAQTTDSKRDLTDQLIVKRKSTLLGNLSLPPEVKVKHHESKEEKEIQRMKRILEL